MLISWTKFFSNCSVFPSCILSNFQSYKSHVDNRTVFSILSNLNFANFVIALELSKLRQSKNWVKLRKFFLLLKGDNLFMQFLPGGKELSKETIKKILVKNV